MVLGCLRRQCTLVNPRLVSLIIVDCYWSVALAGRERPLRHVAVAKEGNAVLHDQSGRASGQVVVNVETCGGGRGLAAVG